MQTRDFDYELPSELIAQHPAERRTDARMLVVHRDSGVLEHRRISAIGAYLNRGDLLVVNNTKVIPARIYGIKAKTGGAVELLLLEPLGDHVWLVLCRASHRPVPGMFLMLANGRIRAHVQSLGEGGRITVRLESDQPLETVLEQEGDVPLPPYIKRSPHGEHRNIDAQRYQTVYASQPGAVAAPTAGLHFTPELLSQLKADGVDKAEVTLHVGIGTFRPVSVDQVKDHRMDAERYEITAPAADAIQTAQQAGGRIVAVGSTSVRTLESVVQKEGRIIPATGRSDLFIYPPYRFRAVDAMLTNFHLPRSTLLMMVSALAGVDLIRRAYQEAVAQRYRFFSYGDCMLIL